MSFSEPTAEVVLYVASNKFSLNACFQGLCPDCSSKLNYRSKKREVKRIHKQRSNKKKHPSDKREKTDVRENLTEEESESNSTSEDRSEIEASSIWKDAARPEEERGREEEFEEYLEELFL